MIELEELKEYMNYFIDMTAFRERTYYRLILDKKIDFPKSLYFIKWDDLIELSDYEWNKHPNKGWGTKSPPDKIIYGLEFWKLWKDTKILTFKQWNERNNINTSNTR